MEDCIFCKIVGREIPGQKERIWEDDDFIFIKDINPVGEGHSLLITKKHFETLLDLDKDISYKYIEAIKKAGKILMKKYKGEGFNLVLNNGKNGRTSNLSCSFSPST